MTQSVKTTAGILTSPWVVGFDPISTGVQKPVLQHPVLSEIVPAVILVFPPQMPHLPQKLGVHEPGLPKSKAKPNRVALSLFSVFRPRPGFPQRFRQAEVHGQAWDNPG